MRYEYRKILFRVTFSSHYCRFFSSSCHIILHSSSLFAGQTKIFLNFLKHSGLTCKWRKMQNLRRMANNMRRMLPEILLFSVCISLFSTFATVETGHYVKHCCLLTAVTPTDRHKSVRNRYVIERFCSVFLDPHLYTLSVVKGCSSDIFP